MKALIQRVQGRTEYEGPSRREHFDGPGLVVLLGWMQTDSFKNKESLGSAESWILEKTLGLRIFPDADGRMNLNLVDHLKYRSENHPQNHESTGGVLWVSQFTLAAELESGYRPSYSKAMDSNIARERFRLFCESVKAQAIPGLSMIFGDFGQEMSLRYTNWGPLSILLNRDEKGVERVHV